MPSFWFDLALTSHAIFPLKLGYFNVMFIQGFSNFRRSNSWNTSPLWHLISKWRIYVLVWTFHFNSFGLRVVSVFLFFLKAVKAFTVFLVDPPKVFTMNFVPEQWLCYASTNPYPFSTNFFHFRVADIFKVGTLQITSVINFEKCQFL